MSNTKLLVVLAVAGLAACQTAPGRHQSAAKALPKPSLAASKQPAASAAVKDTDSLALIAAAGAGDIDEVKALLAQKPDLKAVDQSGRTALIAAAASGHPMTVKLLAKAGADVNAKDSQGESAVMLAARAGHPDVVRVLKALHADTSGLQALTKN